MISAIAVVGSIIIAGEQSLAQHDPGRSRRGDEISSAAFIDRRQDVPERRPKS
jgi:hypothetical protein